MWWFLLLLTFLNLSVECVKLKDAETNLTKDTNSSLSTLTLATPYCDSHVTIDKDENYAWPKTKSGSCTFSTPGCVNEKTLLPQERCCEGSIPSWSQLPTCKKEKIRCPNGSYEFMKSYCVYYIENVTYPLTCQDGFEFNFKLHFILSLKHQNLWYPSTIVNLINDNCLIVKYRPNSNVMSYTASSRCGSSNRDGLCMHNNFLYNKNDQCVKTISPRCREVDGASNLCVCHLKSNFSDILLKLEPPNKIVSLITNKTCVFEKHLVRNLTNAVVFNCSLREDEVVTLLDSHIYNIEIINLDNQTKLVIKDFINLSYLSIICYSNSINNFMKSTGVKTFSIEYLAPGEYWCESKRYSDLKTVKSNVVMMHNGNFSLQYYEYVGIFKCNNSMIPENVLKLFEIKLFKNFYTIYEFDQLLNKTKIENMQIVRLFNISNITGNETILNIHFTKNYENNSLEIGPDYFTTNLTLVEFMSAEYCEEEVYNNLTWRKTFIGQFAYSMEYCVKEDGSPVKRICSGSFETGAKWADFNDSCSKTNFPSKSITIHTETNLTLLETESVQYCKEITSGKLTWSCKNTKIGCPEGSYEFMKSYCIYYVQNTTYPVKCKEGFELNSDLHFVLSWQDLELWYPSSAINRINDNCLLKSYPSGNFVSVNCRKYEAIGVCMHKRFLYNTNDECVRTISPRCRQIDEFSSNLCVCIMKSNFSDNLIKLEAPNRIVSLVTNKSCLFHEQLIEKLNNKIIFNCTILQDEIITSTTPYVFNIQVINTENQIRLIIKDIINLIYSSTICYSNSIDGFIELTNLKTFLIDLFAPGEYWCESKTYSDLRTVKSNVILVHNGKYDLKYYEYVAFFKYKDFDKEKVLKMFENVFTIFEFDQLFNKTDIGNIQIVRLFKILSTDSNTNETIFNVHFTKSYESMNLEIGSDYTKFNLTLLEFLSAEYCQEETYKNLTWPKTFIGEFAYPTEYCVNKYKMQVKRFCSGTFEDGAKWKEFNDSCIETNYEFENVTQTNLSEQYCNLMGSCSNKIIECPIGAIQSIDQFKESYCIYYVKNVTYPYTCRDGYQFNFDLQNFLSPYYQNLWYPATPIDQINDNCLFVNYPDSDVSYAVSSKCRDYKRDGICVQKQFLYIYNDQCVRTFSPRCSELDDTSLNLCSCQMKLNVSDPFIKLEPPNKIVSLITNRHCFFEKQLVKKVNNTIIFNCSMKENDVIAPLTPHIFNIYVISTRNEMILKIDNFINLLYITTVCYSNSINSFIKSIELKTFSIAYLAPGEYWCESITHFNFQTVKSNVVLVHNGNSALKYYEYVAVFKYKYMKEPEEILLIFENKSVFKNCFTIKEFNQETKRGNIQIVRLFQILSVDNITNETILNIHFTKTYENYSLETSTDYLKSNLTLLDYLSAEYCKEEIYKNLTWPKTFIGEFAYPTQYCLNEFESPVKRFCSGSFEEGAKWADFNDTCSETKTPLENTEAYLEKSITLVESENELYCEEEVYKNLTWPKTFMGEQTYPIEFCMNEFNSPVTRYCSVPFAEGATWDDFNDKCQETNYFVEHSVVNSQTNLTLLEPKSITQFCTEESYKDFTWPKTFAGEFAYPLENCVNKYNNPVKRFCLITSNGEAQWGEFNDTCLVKSESVPKYCEKETHKNLTWPKTLANQHGYPVENCLKEDGSQIRRFCFSIPKYGAKWEDFNETCSEISTYLSDNTTLYQETDFTLPGSKNLNHCEEEIFKNLTWPKTLINQFAYPIENCLKEDMSQIKRFCYGTPKGEAKWENLTGDCSIPKKSVTFIYCKEESYKNLTWPKTLLGEFAHPMEYCVKADGIKATRFCSTDVKNEATWSDFNEDCAKIIKSDLTKELLSLVYSNNTENNLKNVLTITKDPSKLSAVDVNIISDVINNSINSENPNKVSVINIVSNLMDIPENILDENSQHFKSQSNIVNLVDKMLTLNSTLNSTISTKNVLITKVFTELIEINAIAMTNCEINCEIAYLNIEDYDETHFAKNNYDIVIVLNEGPIILNKTDPVFTFYFKSVLFGNKENNIDSAVLGMLMPEDKNNTKYTFTIYFRKTNSRTQKCSSWQNEHEDSVWTHDNFTEINQYYTVCKFPQNLHFALLLADEIYVDDKLLEIITNINFSLSVIGIVGIFITAIVFKRYRNNEGNEILLNFSLAVLIKIILFYTSNIIFKERLNSLCIVFGVALHYSLLAECFWMFFIAYAQYIRYVKIFSTHYYYFRRKAYICGWICPMFPVFLLLALDNQNYIKNSVGLCKPSGLGLYLGLWLPILLVLVFNIYVYIRIMHNIHKKSVIRKSQPTDIFHYKLAIFLLFFLGITYILEFLSLWFQSTILAYLFCLTATLQGFAMFIFRILLNKQTMTMYKVAVKSKRKETYHRMTSVASTTYTSQLSTTE